MGELRTYALFIYGTLLIKLVFFACLILWHLTHQLVAPFISACMAGCSDFNMSFDCYQKFAVCFSKDLVGWQCYILWCRNVKIKLHKYAHSVPILNGLIFVSYQSLLDIFTTQVIYVHVEWLENSDKLREKEEKKKYTDIL